MYRHVATCIHQNSPKRNFVFRASVQHCAALHIWHIGSLDCLDCRKVEKLTDDIADMQAEMKDFETF